VTFLTTAALAEIAGAIDEFGADEEVAGGAVKLTQWRIYAGSDGATDGGEGIPGDEQRKELFVFEESGVQFRKRHSGVHAESEVAGIVMRDLIKAGQVESDVVTRGRGANSEFGAIATRDDGEFFESGKSDDLSDFFS